MRPKAIAAAETDAVNAKATAAAEAAVKDALIAELEALLAEARRPYCR